MVAVESVESVTFFLVLDRMMKSQISRAIRKLIMARVVPATETSKCKCRIHKYVCLSMSSIGPTMRPNQTLDRCCSTAWRIDNFSIIFQRPCSDVIKLSRSKARCLFVVRISWKVFKKKIKFSPHVWSLFGKILVKSSVRVSLETTGDDVMQPSRLKGVMSHCVISLSTIKHITTIKIKSLFSNK